MPRWTALCAVAVLGLAVSACASSKETGFPDPAEVPTGAGEESCSESDAEPREYDDHILVLDNCYRPQHAVVAAGTEVVWLNEGVAPHNVRFADGSVDSNPECKNDPSQCMKVGEEFHFTFDEPGEQLYYCVIHGTAEGSGMAGTVIVE